MICSACGYENQGQMRYCVMCGMPLPHRPMTTPGAQSTLNFTRIPVESDSTHDQGRSVTGSSTTGVLEPSSGNGSTGRTNAVTLPGAIAPVESAPMVDEAPPPELVPDVSLDEYIQKFHYEPPTDPGEVTMLGDAPPTIEANAPSLPVDTPGARTDASPVDIQLGGGAQPPGPVLVTRTQADREAEAPDISSDSVASRLGLEPETAAEERVQRPRFLDVNEPAKEIQPVTSSGMSTIVGPSFLGLSDPPETEVEPSWAQDEGESHSSHWRGWVAAAVLVVFAVLGVMEWRSQASSTDHGILQTISVKLLSWRHPSSPPARNDQSSATSAGTDANAKPDTPASEQPEQPKSSDAQSSATTSPAASATRTSIAAQSSATTPRPSNSTAKQDTAVSPKTAAPTADSTARNLSANESQPPKPSAAVTNGDTAGTARKPAGDQAAAVKPSALGADEMAKAKNASDAAAAAAWLWKATAKGNPDAPVQLADLYIKGNGVPRSCEQAMVLLKTAAAKENAGARNRLGSMYATGNCVQRNRVEAYRWMSSALVANPNSQWAQQNRDQIWQQMTPEEQAAAQKYR